MENKTIKIAHIADCHLRVAQYGSKRRGGKFLQGVLSAVRKAAALGIKYILCSGDLLDASNPGPLVCVEQLERLNLTLLVNDMAMIVTPGNHDPNVGSWLQSFQGTQDGDGNMIGLVSAGCKEHYITGEDSEVVYRMLIAQGDVTLSLETLPYMKPDELRDYFSTRPEFPADILMWHGAIKEFTGFPREDDIEVADFPENQWKLAAVGDQHVHKYTQRVSDGLVVAYPGSTEMCSSAEESDKHMYVYTFEKSSAGTELVKIESVAFPTQRVVRVDINTEEELKAFQEDIIANPDTLAYVRYNKKLPDVVSRMLKPDGINTADATIQATPLMPDRADMNSISRETVVHGPARFFDDHAEELVEDIELRQRISDICRDMLDPKTDHRDQLNKYCENRINIITL